MPLYEYRCQQCGHLQEIRHGFKETHAEPCSQCGAELVRVFTPTGIVFKGSGFYVNDSRKSSGGSAETKSESGDSVKASEAKAGDAKPSETKTSDAKPSEAAPKPSGDSGGGSEKKSSGKSDAAA